MATAIIAGVVITAIVVPMIVFPLGFMIGYFG